MKAILLAAGKGTRISDFYDRPKSTIKISDDCSVLKHTVKLLIENNIEVIIVIGYKHEIIEEELKEYPVKYYYNPFYGVTNSLGSLWIAKKELSEDVLICDADVYWEQDILDKMLSCNNEMAIISDQSRADDGDFFFLVENNQIKKYGKRLERSERNSECANIAIIKSTFVPIFTKHLNELIENERYDLWWENVLFEYIETTPVNVIDISECFWVEIDNKHDYYRLCKYLKTGSIESKLIQKSKK